MHCGHTLLSCCFMLTSLLCAVRAEDPTEGCTRQPFDFRIQKPYNVSERDRYSFSDGVHRMWVMSDDQPFQEGSQTQPRTELRVLGDDYSSGVWQFEGDVYVPDGTTGTCVMQIHPYGGHTVSMIRVYDGDLKHYEDELLGSHVYDRWIHINVVHDTQSRRVRHYVDGEMVLESSNRVAVGASYFKCGVYTQDHPSHYMESRWQNISIWKC